MVFEKDVEGAMDSEANEPRGAGNGDHTVKANDHNKTKTIEVHWACLQRKKFGERMFTRNGGEEES